MKKLVVSSLLMLAVIAVACHRKAVPAVTGTTEAPVVTAPVVTPAKPLYAEADLAAGKTIYETKCAKCHGAKPLDHWTVEGWQPILKSMIPKAKLDSTQAAQVTAYVNTNAKK